MLRSALLTTLAPARCHHCQLPASEASPLCSSCAAALEHLARAAPANAAFLYEGQARSLIAALKFRRAAGLAPWLAAQMQAQLGAAAFERSVLVPVPAHPSNRRARGFNQVALLTDAIASDLGLVVCDVIERSAAVPAQTGGTRATRLALAHDAFCIAPKVTAKLANSALLRTNVVVCDDVSTTGVTLEVCTSLLRDLFYGEVLAVALASVGALHGNTK